MSYSPTIGRWLEQDPAGYIDGPNRYQLEKSNPVDSDDPTGLGDNKAGVVGAGALAGPGYIKVTHQSGNVDDLPATAAALQQALNDAIASGDLITELKITNHGNEDVIDLGDGKDYISVDGQRCQSNDGKNLVPLLQAAIAQNGTVILNGCNTASGSNNITKRLSNDLQNIYVQGNVYFGLRIPFTGWVASAWETYINGKPLSGSKQAPAQPTPPASTDDPNHDPYAADSPVPGF